MGFFTHAHTVDTRPLFPPPMWPGNEAKAKRTLQNSTIFVNVLCLSKRIFKLLQGSYMLYGGQNPLSKLLQAIKTSSFYKLLTSLRWSKLSIRDSTSILQALPLAIRTFRTSTSFLHAWREVHTIVVVNTDTTRFSKAAVCFAMVKTDSYNLQ